MHNSKQTTQRERRDLGFIERLGRSIKLKQRSMKYGKFTKRVFPSILLWVSISVGLLFLFNYAIPERHIDDIREMTSGPWEAFFSVFGILYAIIVGMLVVHALERYNNLRLTIEKELNAIEDVRDFLTYLDRDDKAKPAKPVIRKSLTCYVDRIINTDWPDMSKISKTHHSEPAESDTCRELYHLMKDIGKIETKEDTSKIAVELMMNKVSEITTYRTDRFQNAADYVTTPMRIIIVIFSLTLITSFILMFLEPFWIYMFMVTIMAAAMASLYEMILDLNRPFGGDLWDLNTESFRILKKELGLLEICHDDFSEQCFTEEIHPSCGDVEDIGDYFKVRLYGMPEKIQWEKDAVIKPSDSDVVKQMDELEVAKRLKEKEIRREEEDRKERSPTWVKPYWYIYYYVKHRLPLCAKPYWFVYHCIKNKMGESEKKDEKENSKEISWFFKACEEGYARILIKGKQFERDDMERFWTISLEVVVSKKLKTFPGVLPIGV